MGLPDDVRLLLVSGGEKSTPDCLAAARRVMAFLDGILTWEDRVLPRGYYVDVLGSGVDGLCVPWACESDVPDDQLAYFAADVANGFLTELAAALRPDRADALRRTFGV